MHSERHLGLFGATSLGVGAIVGGGILALAGVAFAATGPGALLAFALNGAIAFLTVASFTRLVRRFPESGGLYTYSKKVFPIEAAFGVGWVVWFASILAGVLYALGFAAFAVEGLVRLLQVLGRPSGGLGPRSQVGFAVAATALYSLSLFRKAGGDGRVATVGKVIVFVVVIVGGAWSLLGTPSTEISARFSPFLSGGQLGLLQAMGYTFIALQGFDLIAAVGGEVRNPTRTIPLAMYLSLGCALAIYLPLLFLMATVGAPPEGIRAAAVANPEGLVAEAAERFLGSIGYWLVIGAGLLSMMSALRANLLAASRVAFTMARDRTLPPQMGTIRGASGTPGVAVAATGAVVAILSVVVANVSVAGAASSLIFLVSFSIVHWAAVLAGHRSGQGRLPVLPVVGGALCLALALFQAFAVPSAGSVVALWMGFGILLYLTLFASGAQISDARAEARDPELARLRGRSPLVLVPIANPASAASLVDVAATLRTPAVGRILLLSIVRSMKGLVAEERPDLRDTEQVLGESLRYSLERSLPAETLVTIAPDAWSEIERVARLYDCETLLLGLPHLAEPGIEEKLNAVLGRVDADIVVVRAPRDWQIAEVQRVLVPLAGRPDHSRLRARLLASLSRSGERSLEFLGVLRPDVSEEANARFETELRALASREAEGQFQVETVRAERPIESILHRASEADLVILGLHRKGRSNRTLGELAVALARQTDVPIVLIGRRPPRSLGLGGRRLQLR